MSNIVEVKNITKKFTVGDKTFHAVKNVSFSIAPGQTYGLVGESGCGKSTIALSMMALQNIDSGTIEFEGKDIFKPKKTKCIRNTLSFKDLKNAALP